MSIDYYGTFPCSVREAISDVELLRMEKARNRARAVLDLMRNDPKVNKSRPESEWTFKTVVLRPEGPQETEMRVADLLADAAPLDALSSHCRNCAFNVRSTDFGCGGAVHYPITEQGERWLLSRLPESLDTKAAKLLFRAIADFGFDGADIDVARKRKELYESAQPLERKWGSFFSKKSRMTSSQILHMAFGVGNLQAAHAKLIAYFLGFVNDEFALAQRDANLPHPDDDRSTVELKFFFLVAALAGTRDVGMLIDA